MKKRITIEDYIKAVRIADRDYELSCEKGWKSKHHIHRNKKLYTRKIKHKNKLF